MSIKTGETLIKRAAYLCDRRYFPDGFDYEGIDFKRSSLEEFDYHVFVVLRSADDILAVFLKDDDENWKIERLPPERWPDDLLDEAKSED